MKINPHPAHISRTNPDPEEKRLERICRAQKGFAQIYAPDIASRR